MILFLSNCPWHHSNFRTPPVNSRCQIPSDFVCQVKPGQPLPTPHLWLSRKRLALAWEYNGGECAEKPIHYLPWLILSAWKITYKWTHNRKARPPRSTSFCPSPCRVLTSPLEGMAEGSSEFPTSVKYAAGSLYWPSSPARHSGCHESHSASLPQRSWPSFSLRVHHDALPLHSLLQVRKAVLPEVPQVQGQPETIWKLGVLNYCDLSTQPRSLPTVHAVSPVSSRLDWKIPVSWWSRYVLPKSLRLATTRVSKQCISPHSLGHLQCSGEGMSTWNSQLDILNGLAAICFTDPFAPLCEWWQMPDKTPTEGERTYSGSGLGHRPMGGAVEESEPARSMEQHLKRKDVLVQFVLPFSLCRLGDSPQECAIHIRTGLP